MLRKLNEKDRADVIEFLSDEASINLFIIGDIEAFGFEEDFQTLWGQFTADDKLEGVLLRFHESFIPYFKGTKYDITGFVNIILQQNGQLIVSGKESFTKRFDEVLPAHSTNTTYFCELTDPNNLPLMEHCNSVQIATEEDAERVYLLIDQIEEFNGIKNDIERIKHKIRTGTGRIYYIENEAGKIVSVAQTTAENSKSAMVVGVATLNGYRSKGYMSMCLTRLCMDVMSEGKTLCLFYDNPEAGRIYHRLGFQTIDNWMILRFK